MIPFFVRFFRLFTRDESYFERIVRSIFGAVATGGAAFADQLADALGDHSMAKPIRVAAVIAAFLSLMVPAGQKNPAAEPPAP